MVWAVFAPGQVQKGALSGTYSGATADAAVGLGLGQGAGDGVTERGVEGVEALRTVEVYRALASGAPLMNQLLPLSATSSTSSSGRGGRRFTRRE